MAENIHVARRQAVVGNVLGFHLRHAEKFVRLAKTFQSDVIVHCKGVRANGKSILSLFFLAAESGTPLALEAEGCDAEESVAALADLISDRSHESEDHNVKAGEITSANEATSGSSFAPRDALQSGPRLDKRSIEFV